MRQIVAGILAHVDSGKTTLSEALLYRSGELRKLGRVDHGDAFLDSNALERERGITIFSKQARLHCGDMEVTLLDTPGHVDFSAEMERTLQVLDMAILVISGTDGVQSHTKTLWRLLKRYNVPAFIFVNKMDLAGADRIKLLAELKKQLDDGCADFCSEFDDAFYDGIAMCDEAVMEQVLDKGTADVSAIRGAIKARHIFPCWFGSALRLEGVDEFIEGLVTYAPERKYPSEFGAKVYKISQDDQGARLTHMKITGGTLNVKTLLSGIAVDGSEWSEKINQIRLYSGSKYQMTDKVPAGTVCVVTGLTKTRPGDGIGAEKNSINPELEPLFSYNIRLAAGTDLHAALINLRKLEEEDPALHIDWNEQLQEIHLQLMGEVQLEILQKLLKERFGLDAEFDGGGIAYKETIAAPVEGVGHYEPLRHYAEVHLLLEPGERGSGLRFATDVSEDELDRNWQRLILTHLLEKSHVGVLTGAPITDMKITLIAGRAHIKHTEGGDFRQATYRAVRQGLMQASSVLLEPYYAFRLEVPPEHIGRAITDMRLRHSTIEAPQESGALTLIKGRGPVTTLGDYATQVAAYTGGRGRFSFVVAGYDRCHNEEAIVAAQAYDPEGDVEHTPDSVFCAHGAGFTVKWSQVADYMHLESCLTAEKDTVPRVNTRNLRIDEKELEAIMEREFGKPRHPLFRQPPKPVVTASEPYVFKEKRRYLLVDGYNVIFAWDELRQLAQTDLAAARDRLTLWLSNYSAFSHCETVLIFDAYRVAGNAGSREDAGDIRVVYTKENETADTYIEKLTEEIGKNHQVRVVSSDGMIQLSAVRTGVLRMPVSELQHEIAETAAQLQQTLDELGRHRLGTVGENQKDS